MGAYNTQDNSKKKPIKINLYVTSGSILMTKPLPKKENKNLSISVHRRSATSPSTHMFTFLRQTEPETLEIAHAAEVFQTTLQVLKSRARQRYKRDVSTPGRIAFVNYLVSQCVIKL